MKAIFCSDLHIKGERPVARLDPDWMETQRQMLRFIVSTANERKLPLFILGDIFDHGKVSTEALNMTVEELLNANTPPWILAGNHDLIGHSYDNVGDCSIGILLKVFRDVEEASCDGWHFGRDHLPPMPYHDRKIRLTHQLVFEKPDDFPPMAKAKSADMLLDEFPDADWIICGDMHHHFHFIRSSTAGTRHVVNLGCTIRHKASELAYTPAIWCIDTDAGTVERITVPDDPAMVTRGHLDMAEAKESRIGGFLEVVQRSTEVSLSYLDNLEAKVPKVQEADVAHELNELIQLCKQESK